MSDEIDTSALADLASRRKTPVKVVGVDLLAMATGTYLAADPSLSGFGLVLFEVDQSRRRYAVHMAQKFSVPQAETGWEDILNRAERLYQLLEGWLLKWVFHTDWGKVSVVHEAPPIGRGKLVSPEISLISGREFRRATARYPLLPMMRRQDHAKLVCGNANADKKVHHAALKLLFPHIAGSELVTNEATRDSLSVALATAQREGTR